MKNFSIPLSYTPIPAEELLSVLQSYANRNHNDLVSDFENKICQVTGSKYAVALNSGTAAIHLGLKALDVQTDDIVLVSTFTYVASVNPIRYLGAIPFFVDSCKDDWNMDPVLLEQGIEQCIRSGKKPKVILVVHTYGMPAKMKEIKQIATHYQIPVLEDAAEAMGSMYEGLHVGTLTEIGIFSFNNNKLFTTYGGGALVTNNQEVAAKVNLWAGQSRDNLPFYEHREIGFNYKMSPLNAAVGLAQLESIEFKISGRRKVFASYHEQLSEKVGWQVESSSAFSNRWITAVSLPPGIKVSDVQNKLAEKGIETRPVWKPMHLQPVFKEFKACANGTAERLFASSLCLPSGNNLEAPELDRIYRIINEFNI
jgi:dTDP-4-amino-4,6-dideoxygalactose transaminase